MGGFYLTLLHGLVFEGLLRGHFPKSTDLYQHSPERLAEVEKEINERPRKSSFGTPHNNASIPLVVSLDGRCHGECGSQKNTGMPVVFRDLVPFRFPDPRSTTIVSAQAIR